MIPLILEILFIFTFTIITFYFIIIYDILKKEEHEKPIHKPFKEKGKGAKVGHQEGPDTK